MESQIYKRNEAGCASYSLVDKNGICYLSDYLPLIKDYFSHDSSKGLQFDLILNNNTFYPITLDSKSPNFIVIGGVNDGKSSVLRSILCQFLTKYGSDSIELYLVDLGASEYNVFDSQRCNIDSIKNVLLEYDDEKMIAFLNELISVINERMQLFSELSKKVNSTINSIDDYLLWDKLPRVVVIMDCAYHGFDRNCIPPGSNDMKIRKLLDEVIRKGNSVGIHFVISRYIKEDKIPLNGYKAILSYEQTFKLLSNDKSIADNMKIIYAPWELQKEIIKNIESYKSDV